MQQDSCVINREQISLKEKDMKAKLFGGGPLKPAPKHRPAEYGIAATYTEETENQDFRRKKGGITNQAIPGNYQSSMGQMHNMSRTQDQKMSTFIDEMK
jgi:hypothetical protein